ncbi:RDD family protein [Isoptericola sp. NPDC057191]|uniref:RDD family protein n=1 Tax=Isoptericola sp. NPDC057191 TaxID=3346041 RepID=UPI003629607B
MTTTCTACGASEQSGAFCSVCGTPTVATAYRTPTAPGASASGPPTSSLEVTTEPELRERTRRAPAGLVQGTAGTPGASPRAPAELPLAGVGRRAGAYVLDLLALSLLTGVVAAVVAIATRLPARLADLGAATTEMGQAAAQQEVLGAFVVMYVVAGLVGFLGWLGLALWDGLAGRTVGNSLLGIRTVAADGGGPVGAGRGLLRWLVLAGCGVVPLVGTVLVLVSPTFDSSGRRQGWQDKAARSLVRDVRDAPPRSFAPASPASPGTAGAPAAAPVGAPAAASADPWAFPAGQGRADGPAGGVITGVPGSSPAAPPSAPAAPVAPVAPAGSAGAGLSGIEAHTVHRGAAGAAAPAEQAAPTAASQRPIGTVSTPVQAPAPVAPVAPVGPVQPAAPAPVADDLEDLEATRFSVSSRRSTGDGSAPPRIVVEVDPERRVHVATRTLVGRHPQQDGGAPATLLRVDDPTRSVSKTHLELVPTADGLQVTDLGSTNGSAVIDPTGAVHELTAGRPVTVGAGWVVQAGARRLTVVGQDAGA